MYLHLRESQMIKLVSCSVWGCVRVVDVWIRINQYDDKMEYSSGRLGLGLIIHPRISYRCPCSLVRSCALPLSHTHARLARTVGRSLARSPL